MTPKNVTPRLRELANPAAAAETTYTDEHTERRIRAYLASVRPLRGCAIAGSDAFERGRALIERLALSSDGTDPPRLQLTASQCADVLNFMGRVEPLEPRTWWNDPVGGPSHLVGHYVVLQAVEDSLRGAEAHLGPAAVEAAIADVIALAPPERRALRRRLRAL